MTAKDAELGRYGAVDLGRNIMYLHTAEVTPRTLRGVLHEILHAIDESTRANLTHDQIRVIAAGLDSTLRDNRNKNWSALLP